MGRFRYFHLTFVLRSLFIGVALFSMVIPRHAFAITCGFGTDIGGGVCMGFLLKTDSSPWSVPVDWNNSNNQVACIGPGGNGSDATKGSNSGAGGGGGAYASTTNLTLSGTVSFVVGAGGSQNDTYFNGAASTTASLSCAPGRNASGATQGAGGAVANSTGTSKKAGGAGAAGMASNSTGGGGGGGAAGPKGDGAAGGPGVNNSSPGGGGGGGANNGASGNSPISAAGADGGVSGEAGSTAGVGGTGSVIATSGTLGAGAGGGGNSSTAGVPNGATGSSGQQFDATHGPGGGGGGGAGRGGSSDGGSAGNGGAYGGGGGGGGGPASGGGGVAGTKGTGGDGLIIIIYTPSSVVKPTVTTVASSGYSSATLQGNITSTGGEAASTRGFAWGTSPTLQNSGVVATTSEVGSFGTGLFSDIVSGLVAGTTYYFRAYALNSAGTGFGTISSFVAGSDTTPARRLRLLEGTRLKLLNGGRIKILSQ